MMHIDHIIPLCQGGPDTVSNTQVLCAACNLKKGKRMLRGQDEISSFEDARPICCGGPMKRRIRYWERDMTLVFEILAANLGRFDDGRVVKDKFGVVLDAIWFECIICGQITDYKYESSESLPDDVAPSIAGFNEYQEACDNYYNKFREGLDVFEYHAQKIRSYCSAILSPSGTQLSLV
jgi:hypothetical protein